MQDPAQVADDSPEQTGQCDDQDLKREAAFDLSLIYRASGSDALARQILVEHCSL